jgi:hypothetical protein
MESMLDRLEKRGLTALGTTNEVVQRIEGRSLSA